MELQPEKIVYAYVVDDVVSEAGMNMEKSVASVEAILNYNFNDKTLLEDALTHSSFTDSPSYERLEFLGDAVLQIAVSNFIYLTYPRLDQGQLSRLLSANVSTEKLARVAVNHGLHKYVRHKAAGLNDNVREFLIAVEEEKEMVVHGGEMKAPKVLADIVESVAAAVYVDCGFILEKVWMVIRKLLEPIVMQTDLEKQPQPVTMLFEACQKDGKQVDIRHWRKGDRNIANVFVDGRFVASGSSDNKDNAKLHAAEAALSKLTRSKSSEAMNHEIIGDINETVDIEDAKKKVHELCHKKRWPKATYRVEHEIGPAHERRYISSVQVELSNKILFVKGDERSRVKDAENSAASMMLCGLRDNGYL